MNPYYTIMESPHRWWILAALSFAAGAIGAIAMIAWIWPHTLARIWFYAGLLLAIFFAVRGALEWKDRVTEAQQPGKRPTPLAKQPARERTERAKRRPRATARQRGPDGPPGRP